jgi:hypothetical protein
LHSVSKYPLYSGLPTIFLIAGFSASPGDGKKIPLVPVPGDRKFFPLTGPFPHDDRRAASPRHRVVNGNREILASNCKHPV